MRLIDADQLLQNLQKDPLFPLVEQYGISRVIENAPTIEAEPIRHGRWIYRVYREYNSLTSRELTSIAFYKCSVCGHSSGVDIDNYCPSCGAKMDEDWEEPEINPCRGCTDYDGHGGCKSNGGCGAKTGYDFGC